MSTRKWWRQCPDRCSCCATLHLPHQYPDSSCTVGLQRSEPPCLHQAALTAAACYRCDITPQLHCAVPSTSHATQSSDDPMEVRNQPEHGLLGRHEEGVAAEGAAAASSVGATVLSGRVQIAQHRKHPAQQLVRPLLRRQRQHTRLPAALLLGMHAIRWCERADITDFEVDTVPTICTRFTATRPNTEHLRMPSCQQCKQYAEAGAVLLGAAA